MLEVSNVPSLCARIRKSLSPGFTSVSNSSQPEESPGTMKPFVAVPTHKGGACSPRVELAGGGEAAVGHTGQHISFYCPVDVRAPLWGEAQGIKRQGVASSFSGLGIAKGFGMADKADEADDDFLRYFLPGTSPLMTKLRARIYRLNVAHKRSRLVGSVLLRGEPGVGKGYAANVIAGHLHWLRTGGGKPFECADAVDIYKYVRMTGSLREQALTALPDDLAESILFGYEPGAYTGAAKLGADGLFKADGHVDIFLDEVGDASLALQAKMLQVLETRSFRPLGASFDKEQIQTDARILFATNQPLEQLAKSGRFRADLYYRIAVNQIELPPLRSQLDQFESIATRILKDLAGKHNLEAEKVILSPADVAWAKSSGWPGNHRQLKNALCCWLQEDGNITLREATERTPALDEIGTDERSVRQAVYDLLDEVLKSGESRFQTYDDLGEHFKTMARHALHQYCRERKLTNAQLESVFRKQPADNIRKQISRGRA